MSAAARKKAATGAQPRARQTARQTVIVGLGRTGLSAARYLSAHGARVAITDSRAEPPELHNLGELAGQLELRLGKFDAKLLADASQVVVSPGVSLAEPFVREALARGIEVVGDIELFARAVRAPVMAITGTNGKSTVTTLVAQMLEAAGCSVRAGGNLGEPALNLLAGPVPDFYVLELSSFQLETTESLAPRAATVLNVSADHLDRYAALSDYAAAKARIFHNCELPIINLDDPLVVAMLPADRSRLGFSTAVNGKADFGLVRGAAGELWLAHSGQPRLALRDMKLSGLHNAANALAALAFAEAADIAEPAALEVLRTFTGLPHRMQWVADRRSVRWIDDSKGTNVGATIAAVGGMTGPLVLIAGGDGKGQDFAPLAPAFRGKVRHVVLIGRDAAQLAQVLHGVCTTERATTMPDAVRRAAERSGAGDTVLLSPACASLDMFRDYAQRGEVFAAAVRELEP
jgi:UDP-N-acetylmuramoylalanine--D-glutamate ligase